MRYLLPALLLLTLGACGFSQEREEKPASETGQQTAGKVDRSFAGRAAPAATFEDPDGEPTSLAEFRGRPLLLNLWATWCAPCAAEMPTLDALGVREKGRLQVLTVSEDLDGRDRVEAFFARRGFRELGTYLDPEMRLMGELGVATLPTTILYDAAGREVWRVAGPDDWTGPRAARLIREASPAEAR
ncbi:MAG TPA: TlpA disulfide reductase family protein [Allosphingosinicella sp.]|jgi:thiol-disulfide isomerase/thioredoxin